MEKKVIKFIRNFSAVVFVLFCCCLSCPAISQAANPTAATLKTGTKYTSYDITGDGKADTILVTVSGKEYDCKVKISINNKTVKTISAEGYTSYITVKIFTLKNGVPLLYIDVPTDNSLCFSSLYQYKNGALKRQVNFMTLFKRFGSHMEIDDITVSGNTLSVRYYTMSFTTGTSYITYKYSWKSGSLKRAKKGTYYQIYTASGVTSTLTANKKLTAYASPTSSKAAFTVKKGAKVSLDKCWISGKKMYIRVKYNGKYGWIKALTSYPSLTKQIFSDVQYAG